MWLALTRPAAFWQELGSVQPDWLAALIAHTGLLFLAGLAAAPAYSELDRAITGVSSAPLGLGRGIGLLLSVALASAGLAALAAGLLWCGFRLAGLACGYRRLFTYSAYMLLPVSLGQALGKLAFALALPLSSNPAEIMAWHFRPFSAGLASLLPHPPLALSLPWSLLAVFDLFGLWALWLGYSGLRPYLGATRPQSPWLGMVLMLVFGMGALGLWQSGQVWLASVK